MNDSVAEQNFFDLENLLIFAPRKGVVAQMVEQRTENPCVTGSIPVDATTDKEESLEHQYVQGFLLLKSRKKVERVS